MFHRFYIQRNILENKLTYKVKTKCVPTVRFYCSKSQDEKKKELSHFLPSLVKLTGLVKNVLQLVLVCT